MSRLIEAILGLQRGALSQRGEYALTFDPPWPWQGWFPAAGWNLIFAGAILWLVWAVYRRETGSRRLKLAAGGLRLVLLLAVLAILNRPMLTLTQTRSEPSVLAVLVDQSLSMQVSDVPAGSESETQSRLASVQRLLSDQDAQLLKDLSGKHELRLYRFSAGVSPIAQVRTPDDAIPAAEAIGQLEAQGQSTRVVRAVREVVRQLHGQRLAGVVILSDGREMPAAATDSSILRDLGVRLYPVPVGSESRIRNVSVDAVAAQDVAFKDDMVAVRVQLNVRGADSDQPLDIRLKRADGSGVIGPDGGPVSTQVAAAADGRLDAELVFRASEVGVHDLVVEANPLSGEITEEDNSRSLQLTVLDAQINLLYVEGHPRWEYRYLKTQMMRDKSIQISTLLTSADSGYAQEGDRPIRFFPQTMDQLLEYDVVLLGDVDPRHFTDTQLQLIRDFVMHKGGGLGMVAGPRYSPQAWRNTPVEQILPVDISTVRAAEEGVEGFRPLLTSEGIESPIFRFLPDRQENIAYVQERLPELYWVAQGITARPAMAEVLAEHPTLSGPDGRRAALVVVGRPGAGRTLFSAIDDSWRWRYYTGESVFDAYWVQQIRYLARGRKVGQRRLAFTSVQNVYELGEQVQLELRLIDDQLSPQLPDALGAELHDVSGKLIASPILQRQKGEGSRQDVFRALVPLRQAGRFTARLPSVASGVEAMQTVFDVVVPRLELSDPRPARSVLSQYASATDGAVIDLGEASHALRAIPSVARLAPVQTSWPMWSSPLLLVLIALVLTTEWVVRKLAGLL